MMEELYVGAAERDITPPLGSQLYGYDRSTFAESVNDPLALRAFYLRQGKTGMLLVSAEVCVLAVEYAKELREKIAKKIGIPAEAILLCATHTHTGPNTSGGYGWGERDVSYCDTVFTPALLEAASEAAANAVPALMGYARRDSLVGINRREILPDNTVTLGQCPWGCFNPKMSAVIFRHKETGETIGTLIHYGAHATAAGNIPIVSADWPGVMCRRVSAIFGGITAFLNGPEGDVGPRLSNGYTTAHGHGPRGDISYVAEMGGVAALDAAAACRLVGAFHTPRLRYYCGSVSLPVTHREPEETARAAVAAFFGERVNYKGQEVHYHEMVAESYRNGYREKEFTEIPQTVFALGDLYFASFPFELFSEIGLRIEKDFGKNVLSLALANGRATYFPTDAELSRGGYEVAVYRTSSLQPYAPNADAYLVKETLQNLKEIE